MKRILVFVGLKITELSALIFVPYGIGLLDRYYFHIGLARNDSLFEIWFSGVLGLVALLILIIVLIWIFKQNWDWAKTLTKK